VLITTVAIMT